MIDPNQVHLIDCPPDLLQWPVTTALDVLTFHRDHGVIVEFSKRTGPGSWPDVPFGQPGDSLQFSFGLVLQIDGTWWASCPMQSPRGPYDVGGPVLDDNQIPRNWYYDWRWGALQNHQPTPGEHVGFLLGAGNLRHVLDGSQSPIKERAGLVEFVWPGTYGRITPVWVEGQLPPGPPVPSLNSVIADELDHIADACMKMARELRAGHELR